MRHLPLVFVGLGLLGAAPAAARPPARAVTNDAELAARLEPLRAKHDVPALGGALVTRDGLARAAVVGVRAAGDPTQATVNDRWHLGSCTKAITATLAAQVVESEALAWETTLAEAFPGRAEAMDAGWRAVPLRLLLGNRAGAPADLHRDGLWKRLWRRDGSPRAQRRQLLDGVTRHAPDPAPGTRYVYSNAGFAMAGAMLEQRLDAPWEHLLAKRVFEPLGLQGAGFGAPGSAEVVDQPRGHRRTGEGLVAVAPGPHADNPPAIGPAGTVHMTLADWSAFVAEHLRGAAGQAPRIVRRPETWARLHAPLAGQDYALGWNVTERPWGGGRVLTHAGSNTMWYAVAWLAPNRGFAVLAVTNVGGDAAAKACDAVAATLIGLHRATPDGE